MNKAQHLKILLGSLLIIFIPNMIMILLAYVTETERLSVNLDYFIPLLLLACRQRALFVFTFVFVSLLDFLTLFTQLFPFIRLSDLFYLSKFAFISSSSYQLYGIILILLIITQVCIYLKKYKREYSKMLLILFNVIIFYYAYDVYFLDNSSRSFRKVDTGLVGSQAMNNISYITSGFIQTYTMEGDIFQKSKVKGSTADLFRYPNSHDKVLLIVNESWGVTGDVSVQNDVMSPILNSTNAYKFKQDTLSFVGATIAGELRELCARAPLHYNLKNKTEGFENCLPNKYKNLGYNTVAVHGAIGFMYDRQYWYPRAGFQQTMFRDKGLDIPNSRCYSFPGNCDSDIADRVVQKFKSNDKLFLYWLTLNTHAIYDKRDLEIDLFNCSKFKIEANTAACRNLKLQKQFFYTLSKMIEHSSLSGTRVIVVGDHKPPLIEGINPVFITGKIPVLEFETRQ